VGRGGCPGQPAAKARRAGAGPDGAAVPRRHRPAAGVVRRGRQARAI